MSEERRFRVLVVDDDPVILRLLEVNFRLSGFDVATAARGEVALEVAAESRPDVVLLDVMMPGLGGPDVARLMREIPGLEGVPIAFISARLPEEGDELVAPPVTHIEKPFDPLDVVATVRSLAEGAAQ
jgi:DNA-binding response OmpR family regulator